MRYGYGNKKTRRELLELRGKVARLCEVTGKASAINWWLFDIDRIMNDDWICLYDYEMPAHGKRLEAFMKKCREEILDWEPLCT